MWERGGEVGRGLGWWGRFGEGGLEGGWRGVVWVWWVGELMSGREGEGV